MHHAQIIILAKLFEVFRFNTILFELDEITQHLILRPYFLYDLQYPSDTGLFFCIFTQNFEILFASPSQNREYDLFSSGLLKEVEFFPLFEFKSQHLTNHIQLYCKDALNMMIGSNLSKQSLISKLSDLHELFSFSYLVVRVLYQRIEGFVDINERECFVQIHLNFEFFIYNTL